MRFLERAYKYKNEKKFVTDRYEPHYIFIENDQSMSKTIWGAYSFIGPGAYDLSHVDSTLSSYENTKDGVAKKPNPYYWSRGTLSAKNAMFNP